MNRHTRLLKIIFLAGILGMLPFGVQAQTGQPQASEAQQQRSGKLVLPKINYVVVGRDFTKYEKPLPKTRGQANQVEVIYFFWYGSDLSWKIDRNMREWAASQPYPVLLSPSPVILGDSPYQILGARIFFTLKQLGREQDLGPLFFDAVQGKHVDMTNPQAIVDWFAVRGIDERTFKRVINSNEVKSSTLNVYRTMRDYDIQAVPTIVLDGQYQIRVSNKFPPERVAAVAQFMAQHLSKGGPRP